MIWLHASRELQIGDTSLRTAQGEQTPKVELVGKDLLALRFGKPLPTGQATLKIRYTGKLPCGRQWSLPRARRPGLLHLQSL